MLVRTRASLYRNVDRHGKIMRGCEGLRANDFVLYVDDRDYDPSDASVEEAREICVLRLTWWRRVCVRGRQALREVTRARMFNRNSPDPQMTTLL